ncbi:MAG: hypothetical protein OHK0032_01470 [Thermodesulfovibrionales bacterium]
MRTIFFLAVIAFLFLEVDVTGAKQIEVAPETGKYAPAFNLKDINGRKVAFSEFKDKVVLLNFWATWCGPCRAEMPSLNNLYTALKDKGFVVVAISVDTSEKPVKSFVSEKRISFPVLMDKDKEVAFDQYGVIGLPTSFLIDRKGVIVEKFMGEREWNSPDMKNKILRLLDGR